MKYSQLHFSTASGLIQSDLVFQTMCLVDRQKFMIDSTRAYIDAPQQIGYGKTISAPHMVNSYIHSSGKIFVKNCVYYLFFNSMLEH